MIDIQNVFYGVCGLLAAISITHPGFYIKYSSYLLVAAYSNMVVILAITLAILKLAPEVVSYRDNLNLLAKYLSEFLMKIDNYQAISYMILLAIVWWNLRILSFMLCKYENMAEQK